MTLRSHPERDPDRPRRGVAGESGLTLIEVIFTALIVVLLAAATATALISTARASGDEQYQSEADAVAAQDQDELRSLSDAQLNALESGTQQRAGYSVVVGGMTYYVTSKISLSSATASGGCSASSGAFFLGTSTVNWTAEGRSQTLSDSGLLDRPVVGQLIVQTSDQTKTPLPGVSVSLSGSSSQKAETNVAGCAIFAGLLPGASVNVSFSDSGYVDINGNNPSTTATVVPAIGTTVSQQLGLASGPISATYKSFTGSGGEADGLSWLLTGMAAPGTSTSATSTSGTSTSTLYPTTPWVTGQTAPTYQVWGGRCVGEEPPSGSVTTTAVPKGQAVSGLSVTEPALQVAAVNDSVTTTTRNSNGQSTSTTTTKAVKPNDIVLTYRGGGCVDSWAATVTSAPGTLSASGTSAPAAGWLANPGQPYALGGTLTVCADYYDASAGNWYSGTAVTGNSTFSSSPSANSVTVPINESSGNVGKCGIQTS